MIWLCTLLLTRHNAIQQSSSLQIFQKLTQYQTRLVTDSLQRDRVNIKRQANTGVVLRVFSSRLCPMLYVLQIPVPSVVLPTVTRARCSLIAYCRLVTDMT